MTEQTEPSVSRGRVAQAEGCNARDAGRSVVFRRAGGDLGEALDVLGEIGVDFDVSLTKLRPSPKLSVHTYGLVQERVSMSAGMSSEECSWRTRPYGLVRKLVLIPSVAS
jgi:hypothetical protein